MPLDIIEAEERELVLSESTGYSSIPDQFRQKSIDNGFHLNLLVVGRRGLGTTTLINSIFNAPLLDKDRSNEIEISKNEIYENKVKLSLVVTTYHGKDSNKIVEYITEKNLEYFYNKNGFKVKFLDNRIHACIYLLPIDEIMEEEIKMMRRISKKCNLIPIIPKADIFTPEEMVVYKQNILEMLKNNEISIYWPSYADDDEEMKIEAQSLISKFPLSTAASENIYEHKGEYFRGRKYKWGFVNVCCPDISDFLDLRRMLAHSFLDDLLLQTESIYYEAFRKKCANDKELCDKIDEELREQVKKEAHCVIQEEMEKKKRNEIEIEMISQKNEDLPNTNEQQFT